MKAYSKNALLAGLCLTLISTGAMAATKTSSHTELQNILPQIQALSQDQNVVSAVLSANSAHASLDAADLRKLGRDWHDGLQGKPSTVLSEVNNSALSQQLKSTLQNSHGLYQSITVTDQKGLVIGETENAKHYAEASQGFFKKIVEGGPSAVYYGKAPKGSSGAGSVGVPVVDQGKVIGTLVVEVQSH